MRLDFAYYSGCCIIHTHNEINDGVLLIEKNSGRVRIHRNLLLGLEVYKAKKAFVQRFSHNADLSIEVDRRILSTHGAASGSTPLNCATDRVPSSS